MSNRGEKPSDKGQEGKKNEEGMQDGKAQKEKSGNSSKDEAASSIKSEPNVSPKSKQSGEDKGDETMTEGEWMKDHPWEGRSPNDKEELKMASRIGKSTVYTLKAKWYTDDKVDLTKIYSNLPKFIKEMKGQSCRKDLEWLIKHKMTLTDEVKDSLDSNTPHILEIVQEEKGVKPTDKASPVDEKQELKAFSSKHPKEPNQANYYHLDCEYMLKMYLPDSFKDWFNIEHGKRIRSIKPQKKDQRWIFVPSFRRAKIALMKWPGDDDQDEEEDENEDDEDYKYDDFDNDDVDDDDDDNNDDDDDEHEDEDEDEDEDDHDDDDDSDHDCKIITEDSTIRILVVRPFEFDKYVRNHGHRFPVISLPQEEIGAGYARFWIQKIALHLKLHYIWMIDDSVECFYEYNPQKITNSYIKQNRRRPFELVFGRIEMLVKESQEKKHPIAAMSPKRFRPFRGPLKNPFVCSPPRIAVYLNLELLKEKGVYYRPELRVFEDMIFGYECEQNGLNVFMDNRILLQDHKWGNTGARSLSVKQKCQQN